MADFQKVARVSDFGEGEVKSFFVETESFAICVCRAEGNFYAFKDECTHQAFPLSDGDIEGRRITCCYHGAEFDVETGEALCLPAVESVETYEVRVEGDDILVRLSD